MPLTAGYRTIAAVRGDVERRCRTDRSDIIPPHGRIASRLSFTWILMAYGRREASDLFNSSEKRLARALLLLANFGKENSSAIQGSSVQELPRDSRQALDHGSAIS